MTADRPLFADALAGPSTSYLIRAHDVRMENVTFLERRFIPIGSLTMLVGIGGLGKSHIAVHHAARASRGQLEGDVREPVGVVIATAEDALAQTMVPRLVAAGADLNRISFVNLEAGFSIPDDLRRLEDALDEDTGLIVIDPLIAFIPTRLDSHKDQHARAALAPLAGLAERRRLAIEAIMHLNKSAEAGALFLRVSSSVGFLNAARSALLVAPDPDDDTRRILAHGKHNLSEPGESRRFKIEGTDLESDGEIIRTSRVCWLGSSERTIEELLRSDHRSDPREKAERWLIQQVASGPMPVEWIRSAAECAGHAWRTVERAKAELGVEAYRDGGLGRDGRWFWRLIPATSPVREDVAALGDGGAVSAGHAKTATFLPIEGGLGDGGDSG
jgi:hypothetical protein